MKWWLTEFIVLSSSSKCLLLVSMIQIDQPWDTLPVKIQTVIKKIWQLRLNHPIRWANGDNSRTLSSCFSLPKVPWGALYGAGKLAAVHNPPNNAIDGQNYQSGRSGGHWPLDDNGQICKEHRKASLLNQLPDKPTHQIYRSNLNPAW